MTTTREVVDILRQRRQHFRIRQKTIAGMLGISPNMMTHLENGRKTAHFDLLAKWADALGMRINIVEDRP